MSIVMLKEVALRYEGIAPIQLFWDYLAMHILWQLAGSEPKDGTRGFIGRKAENIDNLYKQITYKLSNTILSEIQNIGLKLKEAYLDTPNSPHQQLLKVGKELQHALTVENYEEIHSAIKQFLRLELDNALISNSYDATFSLPRYEIKEMFRFEANPVRFFDKVSPIVSRQLKANLDLFVPHDQIDSEKGMVQKMISAPRGKFTYEEIEKILDIKLNVIAQGNATSGYGINPKIHLDKLSDGTFIFFMSDRSDIKTFPDADAAISFIQTRYGTTLNKSRYGRGYNALSPEEMPSATPPPSPTPPIAPTPSPTSAPENPVGHKTPSSTSSQSPDTIPASTVSPINFAPPLPTGTPALGTPMAGKTPKRLVALEKELERMGYKWSEEEQMYKNAERGSSITIFPDNSSLAKSNTGKEYNFSNLGELLKMMYTNRSQTTPSVDPTSPPNPNPTASLTEMHYKSLFKFLYN